MPNYELVAENAYNIFRGGQRDVGSTPTEVLPHWTDLPDQQRKLLSYVAEFSRISQVTFMTR